MARELRLLIVLAFRMRFSGGGHAEAIPPGAAGFDSGSSFAVSLYAADGFTPLGNVDPLTNALLAIDLTPAGPAGSGGFAVTVSDPALAQVASAGGAAVPEPQGLLLWLTGAAMLAQALHLRRTPGSALSARFLHAFVPTPVFVRIEIDGVTIGYNPPTVSKQATAIGEERHENRVPRRGSGHHQRSDARHAPRRRHLFEDAARQSGRP